LTALGAHAAGFAAARRCLRFLVRWLRLKFRVRNNLYVLQSVPSVPSVPSCFKEIRWFAERHLRLLGGFVVRWVTDYSRMYSLVDHLCKHEGPKTETD